MAATVYNLFTSNGMPPGAKWSFEWKNLPDAKAYRVDAHPFYPGSYQEGYNSTTEIEVTRVSRRTRSIQKQGDIGVTVELHNDILGEVKNVGTHSLDFDLYLIAFS